MIKYKEKRQERITAITIWGLPLVIVVVVLLFFPGTIHFESFLVSGSIGILLFVTFCYIISSYNSFIGFVLPLFSHVKNNFQYQLHITKPTFDDNFSKTAKILLERLKNASQSDKLYVSCIVVHDFLEYYADRNLVNGISQYIPSVLQMREFPFESLCLMLSSQEKLEGAGVSNEYYNFELILQTCLKGSKDISD